ncbi:unnamed protein product [Acanthoscelides obtectus]|uniref:Uncharacterized protein n=1 Tax=Acanthoscelides obtectus TaxID=200917 RepID=A0A9P0KIM4_ACAOB|nr:unnamed protein product [Acanthoscelides obtectus]CAK1624813.1 hypothetical protein AOBTE_LOCUS2776 [Acanthoscelides obtectus]
MLPNWKNSRTDSFKIKFNSAVREIVSDSSKWPEGTLIKNTSSFVHMRSEEHETADYRKSNDCADKLRIFNKNIQSDFNIDYSGNNISKRLLGDLLGSFELESHITEYTRIASTRYGISKLSIDYIITNCPEVVYSGQVCISAAIRLVLRCCARCVGPPFPAPPPPPL